MHGMRFFFDKTVDKFREQVVKYNCFVSSMLTIEDNNLGISQNNGHALGMGHQIKFTHPSSLKPWHDILLNKGKETTNVDLTSL